MNRSEEIRHLLKLPLEELLKRGDGKLELVSDLGKLHQHFAESIANEIKQNNKSGDKTKLILPVGPIGQYPILAELINEQEITLDNCYLFFMDEYCDDNGHVFPKEHPLSFKGKMEDIFFDSINPDLNIPEDQVVFPNHNNLHKIVEMIEDVGGIDTCYGGIGIHGHVAFNEPEQNVKFSGPRLVYLNEYTVTINSIRANVGGDLINFPRKAVTLGMRQILDSKRIRLYCRNDIPTIDWANTVLRLAVLGEPGEDYPVTLLTDHDDYKVIADRATAQTPKHIL